MYARNKHTCFCLVLAVSVSPHTTIYHRSLNARLVKRQGRVGSHTTASPGCMPALPTWTIVLTSSDLKFPWRSMPRISTFLPILSLFGVWSFAVPIPRPNRPRGCQFPRSPSACHATHPCGALRRRPISRLAKDYTYSQQTDTCGVGYAIYAITSPTSDRYLLTASPTQRGSISFCLRV